MAISMLVVDYEETDVIRFKRAARKAGVQRRIEICRGGAEAFGLLASQAERSTSDPGYLLVSDLKMPGMDGLELLGWAKTQLVLRGVPGFAHDGGGTSQRVDRLEKGNGHQAGI